MANNKAVPVAMPALYRHMETQAPVATHSMLKTWRRCPRQTYYKYVLRLKPKMTKKPLKRGVWVHRLLEVHYKGGDWKAEHKRLSEEFGKLFDEERDFYGDLPREIGRIMRGYFWHYKHADWKVHDTEFILETTFPDGSVFRCKIDLLIEDQFGLWIVDHKSHARLPSLEFRLRDAQSADYVWCALQNGIPVRGHIWNYLRWKAPTVPQFVYKGTRLSRRAIETDYPTMLTALKRHGFDPDDYDDVLAALRAQRYEHGMVQTSPFFRRDVLERKPAMLRRVANEAYHSTKRMNEYPWDKTEHIERSVDWRCERQCDFNDLCTVDLMGGNSDLVMRRGYTVGDPLDYYNDDDYNRKVAEE